MLCGSNQESHFSVCVTSVAHTFLFLRGGKSSMDKPQCPICGKVIDDEDYDCLDNGSPAHFKCAEEERKNEKLKES